MMFELAVVINPVTFNLRGHQVFLESKATLNKQLKNEFYVVGIAKFHFFGTKAHKAYIHKS